MAETAVKEVAPSLLYGKGSIVKAYSEGTAQSFLNEYASRRDIGNSSLRDGVIARQQFIHQVKFIWTAEPEFLVPSSKSIDEVVFIGSWQKHPESGLYVRLSRESIALAKEFPDILRREPNSIWFYEWRPELGGTKRKFEVKGGMSLAELVKASGLVMDFDNTLKNCEPYYA